MKILILDFNDDFYPLYERKFNTLSFVTLNFAKDITSALAYLKTNKPDCILLNHLFYNKLDYYAKIRQTGFTGDIIIVIAGKENIVKRSRYNGISGILDKSLNGTDFRKKFCSLVKLNNMEMEGNI